MNKLFKNITASQQSKLLKLLETNILYYKKDTPMLTTVQGNIIGIILKGHAHIIRTDYNGNQMIIEELEEESIFGSFISALSSDEYQIITKEDTKILIIDYDHILENDNSSYSYYNQFIKNLLEISTNIIDEKNDRISILTKKTIRDKLLEYFNIYSRKHGNRVIYLPYSYTELADYLAVDRSAMQRELKYLKEEGFIETKGRRITLQYR